MATRGLYARMCRGRRWRIFQLSGYGLPEDERDRIKFLLDHGEIGYDQDLPFEQRLRDVIGLEIGDGTPRIMNGIVAREVFGREFMPYR